MTSPILCLTPNAALDRTLLVPDFEPGDVLRCKETVVTAGGKGLNVARAVKIIGGQPYTMALLGGHLGRLVADLTQVEGIDARWTWFEGETRICTIIVPEHGPSTVINETGSVTPDDWNRFVNDVIDQAINTSLIALSGSLPRGVPAGAPGDLIQQLYALSKPMWIDTSGAALRTALDAVPTGVKVNGDEIGDLLNRRVETPEDAVAAARDLQTRGIQWIAITLGEKGAVLVGPESRYYARSPQVEVVSAVGSGDCFFAGLLTSLGAGQGPAAALASAVAAGTANAMFPGGARFPRATYDNLLAHITVEPL